MRYFEKLEKKELLAGHSLGGVNIPKPPISPPKPPVVSPPTPPSPPEIDPPSLPDPNPPSIPDPELPGLPDPPSDPLPPVENPLPPISNPIPPVQPAPELPDFPRPIPPTLPDPELPAPPDAPTLPSPEPQLPWRPHLPQPEIPEDREELLDRVTPNLPPLDPRPYLPELPGELPTPPDIELPDPSIPTDPSLPTIPKIPDFDDLPALPGNRPSISRFDDQLSISGSVGSDDITIESVEGGFLRITIYAPNSRGMDCDTPRESEPIVKEVSTSEPYFLNAIRVEGRQCSDTITLKNYGSADINVFGGDGDDVIDARSDVSSLFAPSMTINGGPGSDVIYAGNGDDWVDGGPGDDNLYGLNGIDTIHGGPGRDFMVGGDGNDLLSGGPGDDQIYGGLGNDSTPKPDDEHDGRFGSHDANNDLLCGNGGDDAFYDSQGVNRYLMGSGKDTIYRPFVGAVNLGTGETGAIGDPTSSNPDDFHEVCGDDSGPTGINDEPSWRGDQVATPSAAKSVTGDANGDHVVDFNDFLILSASYGKEADATFADGDFTGDGGVDFNDFLILADNFGKKIDDLIPDKDKDDVIEGIGNVVDDLLGWLI